MYCLLKSIKQINVSARICWHIPTCLVHGQMSLWGTTSDNSSGKPSVTCIGHRGTSSSCGSVCSVSYFISWRQDLPKFCGVVNTESSSEPLCSYKFSVAGCCGIEVAS
ncbi:hypothetical protein TB2_014683 [Malus domestica]